MAIPIHKNIAADGDLGSYVPFVDFEWEEKIVKAAEGSHLDQIVFDLVITWRSAASVPPFPWVLLNSMKKFAEGLSEPPDFGRKLMDAIANKLLRELGDLRPTLRKKIDAAIVKIHNETREAYDKVPPFDMNQYWQALNNLPFKMAIWASQRLCYAAFYYTYEDFLVRSYKLASGESDYRISQGGFAKKLAAVTSEALRDECWANNKINVARLARHSIAHAGGRETPDLKKVKHGFDVVDDEIQILATHTRGVYELLKPPALAIVEFLAPKHQR